MSNIDSISGGAWGSGNSENVIYNNLSKPKNVFVWETIKQNAQLLIIEFPNYLRKLTSLL